MADFRDYAGISLDDYLSHHGILGMIWGKRNGPPYPLDAGDHSAREKKAGWRKSLDSNSPAKDKRSSKGSSNELSGNNDMTGKKGLSDKQKKVIKTAVVVGAAALAAYGAYKLYQHRDLISLGKRASNLGESSGIGQKASSGPVLGIHNNPDNSAETKLFNKISGEMSEKENIDAVNPHFNDGLDYQMNCGNCAIATELRRRGFDVEAGGNPGGITVEQMTKLCKNLKSDSVFRPKAFSDRDFKGVDAFDTAAMGKRVKSLIEKSLLKQYPANSRGCLFVPTALGSHWISWEIDASGKFNLINSQNQSFDLEKDFFWMFTNDTSNVDTSLTAIRLDDVDFNDTIKDIVKSRH